MSLHEVFRGVCVSEEFAKKTFESFQKGELCDYQIGARQELIKVIIERQVESLLLLMDVAQKMGGIAREVSRK